MYESLAPEHIPCVSLSQSISELVNGMKKMGFNDANFRASDMMRLKVLQNHQSHNRLDKDLYWIV